MKFVLIKLIRFYAYLVSPLLGSNCRFVPTCSVYTTQAIEKHGALKGLILGIKRLSKCHPWNHSDPDDSVPTDIAWGEVIGYKHRKPTLKK
jgi:hypothetical protein